MPLYEYRCKQCGHRFEKIQTYSAPDEKTCPVCGGEVERLISAPAVQFKGSGFYSTDYGSKPSSGSVEGGAKSSEKSSEGGSSSKAESTAASGESSKPAASGSGSEGGSSAPSSSTGASKTSGSE